MNFIILLVIMTTISSLVKASIVEIGSVKSEFGGRWYQIVIFKEILIRNTFSERQEYQSGVLLRYEFQSPFFSSSGDDWV